LIEDAYRLGEAMGLAQVEMIFYEKPTVLVYESPTLVREMAALGKSGRS
jgi:hypothetical protein